MITVSIYEYDEEGHLEIVKEEGRQLGIAEGRQLGLAEGLNKGINAFIKLCKDMNLSDDDTVNKLIENYQLSKDEAVKAVKIIIKNNPTCAWNILRGCFYVIFNNLTLKF